MSHFNENPENRLDFDPQVKRVYFIFQCEISYISI